MNISALNCITRAKNLAIGLDEAKTFLKITNNEEDSLLQELIGSVTHKCEGYTSRALLYQTWRVVYRQFARISITMPIKPAYKILKIELRNFAGVSRIFDQIHYELVAEENELYFNSFPLSYLMKIDYVAGYGSDHTKVPSELKAIMLSHLACLYTNRSDEHDFSMSIYDEFKTMRL